MNMIHSPDKRWKQRAANALASVEKRGNSSPSVNNTVFIDNFFSVFPICGSVHRVFFLHVILCYSSNPLCILAYVTSFCVITFHLSFGLPVFRCPLIFVTHVLYIYIILATCLLFVFFVCRVSTTICFKSTTVCLFSNIACNVHQIPARLLTHTTHI